MFLKIKAEVGNIDCVINNAGISLDNSLTNKTADEFMHKSEEAKYALTNSTDLTKEACNNNVPMYGEGKLPPKTSGDNSAFKVSGDKVTVKHMLAKVSLESLGVDFKAGSAYANAEFTPVAAFLINVLF